MPSSFHPISEILKDLQAGRMVIVVDDEDRENEGDLVVAAEHATPEAVNFMATHGRGLICVPMEAQRLDELGLSQMAADMNDPFRTAWAISVDARKGVSTGISAHDRARTIQVLADPRSIPQDLARPGHVFPLRARDGGVLVRVGHTEACIDLMRLSELRPAGVICEIMNSDGTMSRAKDLKLFAQEHGLKMCTIRDLILYRRRFEKLVHRSATTVMPTEYGEFDVTVYESDVDTGAHVAL
ncbi:MAG: 3,4-dihydroxy-2-butanone-4-phosphate synthase, partial [Candidatus Omnitrophica bacterium]|nr:3,4-dihydroxy-2-butanone-4-phosphate synthase [Candidatus Omnitrophota bacterium]